MSECFQIARGKSELSSNQSVRSLFMHSAKSESLQCSYFYHYHHFYCSSARARDTENDNEENTISTKGQLGQGCTQAQLQDIFHIIKHFMFGLMV